MEINTESIEKLRGAATIIEGDVDHTTFVDMQDIGKDVLSCIPNVIITTVDISVMLADLLNASWEWAGVRTIDGMEYTEFMMLAPFAMRIALIGTNYCAAGEYIMFREGYDEEENSAPVLLRVGIQV